MDAVEEMIGSLHTQVESHATEGKMGALIEGRGAMVGAIEKFCQVTRRRIAELEEKHERVLRDLQSAEQRADQVAQALVDVRVERKKVEHLLEKLQGEKRLQDEARSEEAADELRRRKK